MVSATASALRWTGADGGGHRNIDNAQLVTSELAGNAVLHTRSARPGGLITTKVTEVRAGLVRIEVIDEGSATLPRPRTVSGYACHGRGLRLVELLSERWGIRLKPLRWKAVWAEVLTSEDALAATMSVSLDEAET
ncbi:ATP-binding protein [Nonomuraea sp. NPDC005650]|uniref:ATP-binding protein n=1 Tax=Nonomuraea sp. NPDC005650 TaxID=3157045 RepID=UPI0033BEEEF4